MQPSRIYLFNRGQSSNIGDQLIHRVLDVLLQQLGASTSNSEVFTPASPGKIARITSHIASYVADVRHIAAADKVIIGGGNMVMDKTGVGVTWAVHQFWLSLWCLLLNRPLYYAFVGATPLHTPLAKILYRFALRRAVMVSARDDFSADYLTELTGRADIIQAPDPVTVISRIEPRPDVTRHQIALCPAQLWPSVIDDRAVYEEYITLHVQLIERLRQMGEEVCLLANDPDVDLPVCEAIRQRVDIDTAIFDNHADYLTFMAGLKFIVSTRMHAVICATSYGAPAVGLGWQPKVRAFFEAHGLPGYLDVLAALRHEPTEATVEKIVQLYTDNLAGQSQLRADVGDVIQILKQVMAS